MSEKNFWEHQTNRTAEVQFEKGGGKRYVEELSGRTINELYQRLLQLGELARANVNKHQTHGNKEQVLKMLDHAKPVPIYMTNSQIDKVQKELEETADKINNLKKSDIYKQQLKENIETLKQKNEIKVLKEELKFQQELNK
jgi:hypothetical protein